MKGCIDHIHQYINVSIEKVSLVYRLLIAVPAKVKTNLNLYYDKDYTQYGVTRYRVVRYTFTCRFLLHCTVTTQGYSSPSDNLGPCTTMMYPQDKTNHHDSI
jgi:hypothetical protein